MNTSLIIFDFDGVIVDSFDTGFAVQREIQADQDFMEADFRACFEGNIYETGKVTKYCSIIPAFFDIYAPRFMQLPPVPGIVDVIKVLSASYTLVIISSTKTSLIYAWLEKYELSSYFFDILGADEAESKVEKFEMLFEKYNVEQKNCLFITDTLGDLREAKKVGIPSIAVTYGFHSEETLRKGEFAALVHHASDIVEAVEVALK